MLKRKLKKILIILLLVIMVVQMIPISYAANDKWKNMDNKDRRKAILGIKGDDYNKAINEFLTTYGLDIEDNILVYLLETLKKDGTYEKDYDFRNTYIEFNNMKHGRAPNTGIETENMFVQWLKDGWNGFNKFLTGESPVSTKNAWENLPDNEKWEIMTESDKLDLVLNFSAGTINDETIKEFLNTYGITAEELYQLAAILDRMFPDDPQYDALIQTRPEIMLQGSGEIAQNGQTNVDSSNGYANGETDTFGQFIDGIAGVLFIGVKILPAAVGKVLSLIMNGISGEKITVYNVLFNNVDLTRINFFDSTTGSSTVDTIKQNVAIWYVGIRNLAAVILALILIYVAIRMAISTIAEDRAKYKTMLLDWLTSLCLLFVLHYIMIFTINLNNALVDLLSKAGSSTNLTSVEDELFNNAIFSGFIEGLGNSFAYMMLVGMSFTYFFSYVKRMITLAFLIIIAPLITVTYSIDKMGDGKSQALNTWLREFVYNILIQPFQCIIYLSLVSSVLGMLTGTSVSLINVFIAIYVLMFMYQAEEIVKKIFGFQAESMGKTIAAAAITSTLISKGTSLFKGGNNNNNKVGAPTQYRRRPVTPGGSNSGGSNPGGSNPGGSNPGGSNPGGNNPGGSNSGGSNPGGNNPGGSNPGGSNLGGGSAGGSSTGTSANSNKSKRKIGGVAKNIGGKLLRGNISAGLGLAGLALGLGTTGELSGGVTGAGLGSAASGTINRSMDRRRDKRNEKLRQAQIARDIDAYKAGHANVRNNQLYQLMNDWIEGTAVPEDDDDAAMELYHHIMEHKDGLRESGLSEDDAKDRLNRLFQNTFSGDQSREDPRTLPQQAKDNVANIIRNMRNHFNNNGGTP